MSKRFWGFSLVALIGTLLVALTLVTTYRSQTLDALSDFGADKNVALSRSILKATQSELLELIEQTSSGNFRDRRRIAAESGLAAVILNYLDDLEVFRVNVFDRRNVAVFSTDQAIVGIQLPVNPGVTSALGGEVLSDLVEAGEFNELDQRLESRNLVQTYLPINDANGDIVGVLEVYSDVTDLMVEMDESRRAVTFRASLVLAAFLAVLVWLYARIDRNLAREQETVEGYLVQIERANDVLADQVQERSRMLEEARNFVQSTIDGLPDPAIVVDREYRVTTSNAAARRAFDLPNDQHTPVHCYRQLFGRDAPCENGEERCALQSGRACALIETDTSAEGKSRQVQYRMVPLRNPDGEMTGAIEVVHDLNEGEKTALRLQREKEEAELAGRVKAAFVATMSHEIRTPMNAVLGMTDLLRLTDLTRKQEGYVRTIQSSGAMLMSLVDNIIDYVRIGEGSLSLQKRDFRLSELLDNVIDIMGFHASASDLELVGVMEADPDIVVSSDLNRLRQVLVNLVGNAIKFSHEGEIVVRVSGQSLDDGRIDLKFSVSDQGEGMPQAVRDRLFRPFAVSTLGTAGSQHGSGLGLAICKEIVERMEGRIEVQSMVGSGTIVSFVVPVDVARRSSDVAPAALRDERVLVINHSDVIGQSVCSASRSLGMRCSFVRNCDEAVEALRAALAGDQPFSAVVIDSRGAYATELASARRIRALDGCEFMPVILLVPVSKPIEPGQVSSIGHVYCVSKPVQFGELRETLFKAADEHVGGVAGGEPADGGRGEVKILVAEDNPVNQQVLAGMLASLGYDADCVDDGEAVLERLARDRYDIVLMDCQMPGLDGDEATRLIRGDLEAYPDQPVVIAVTADTTVEHRSACLEAGMDDFFPKPVRLDALRSGLARWQKRVAARSSGGRRDGSDLIERLRKRTGSRDESFLGTYIDLFLKDSSDRIRLLAEALEAGNYEQVQRESHSLKGACLEFGADRMGRLCEELRSLAAGGNLEEGGERLGALEREFDRIRPVFESELKSSASRAASRPG